VSVSDTVTTLDAGLKPAACGSLKTWDAKKSPKIAIWAPSHNFCQAIALQLRHVLTIGKNLLSSNVSHNMVNFSPLAAEIG